MNHTSTYSDSLSGPPAPTIVVVGGVAGGMSAAARLARLLPFAHVVVFEASSQVSYANCGLPYFIGDVILDEADLILQTPTSLSLRFGLDVRVSTRVTSIDPEQKTVSFSSGNAGGVLSYDYLVLSPGATPIVPPIVGSDLALTLRTVEDARLISLAAKVSRHALIIGAGFVGLELAENLVGLGLRVTIVEASDQILAPLDPEMAHLVQRELVSNGVDLRLGSTVTSIFPDRVLLDSGEYIPADLVISAIGVRPDSSLAVAANLELGPSGAIATDEYSCTSNPYVYAIGDAAEKIDSFGAPSLIALANLANAAGRRVADHIADDWISRSRVSPVTNPVYDMSPHQPTSDLATSILRVFGLVAGTTGLNEKTLIWRNIPYLAIHTHPQDHAGYFPGATSMAIKLLVDPSTHLILGAQIVGQNGVDKRIDVISTAISAGLVAPKLADLALAYAPEFSSAKDPINMLGYIAENRLSGRSFSVALKDLPNLLEAGYTLLDVRTREEYAAGHIPGALNIPVDDLRAYELTLPDKIVVYCRVGARAHTAAMYLSHPSPSDPTTRARSIFNLDGGYLTYLSSPHLQLRSPAPSSSTPELIVTKR